MTDSTYPMPHTELKLDVNGAPYNPDLSPFYPLSLHPEPIAGHFVLPENAPWRKTDLYHAGTINPNWNDASLWDGAIILDDYQTVMRRNPDCHVHAYSRPIAEDPDLYARMKEYAETKGASCLTPEVIEARLKAALFTVAELEAQLKKATEVKVRDWVVALSSTHTRDFIEGHLYKVRALKGNIAEVERDENGSVSNGWHTGCLRRATTAEVTAHLAKTTPPPLPKLHGYEGSYTKDERDGTVTYGCAEIDVALLREVLKMASTSRAGNRGLQSITLDSGKTLTLTDIRAVLAHVDFVNGSSKDSP